MPPRVMGLGTGLVYADAHHDIPNRIAQKPDRSFYPRGCGHSVARNKTTQPRKDTP